MIYTNNKIILGNNENVKQFLDILKNNNMTKPIDEMTILFNYIDSMEKQFDKVIIELHDIKGELEHIKNKKNPVIIAYLKVVTTVEAKVNEARQQLNTIKINIVNSAKQFTADFKQKGMSALNTAFDFLGIKKGLENIQKGLEKSTQSINKFFGNLKVIGNEFKEIKSHSKNIVGVISGKNKAVEDIGEKPLNSISKTLQNLQDGVSQAKDKLDNLSEMRQNTENKKSLKDTFQEIKENQNSKPIKMTFKEHGAR